MDERQSSPVLQPKDRHLPPSLDGWLSSTQMDISRLPCLGGVRRGWGWPGKTLEGRSLHSLCFLLVLPSVLGFDLRSREEVFKMEIEHVCVLEACALIGMVSFLLTHRTEGRGSMPLTWERDCEHMVSYLPSEPPIFSTCDASREFDEGRILTNHMK